MTLQRILDFRMWVQDRSGPQPWPIVCEVSLICGHVLVGDFLPGGQTMQCPSCAADGPQQIDLFSDRRPAAGQGELQ